VSTGQPGVETRLVVLKGGTPLVLTNFATGVGGAGGGPDVGPQTGGDLNPGGLLLGRNAGAKWQPVRPLNRWWAGQDYQLHVDRDTNRVFYYSFHADQPTAGGVSPAARAPGTIVHLLSSGDEGRSWRHAELIGHTLAENARFATNRPTASGPKPTGYPNVAYFCANVGSIFVPAARACYRSLDAGATWAQTSILVKRGAPQHKQCGTQGEDFGPLDGGYPQAGPKGALYVLIYCGGRTYLARSTDEAATFPILREIKQAAYTSAGLGVVVELRVDRNGTLYLVKQVGNGLVLWTSRNEGRSWSRGLDLTAPEAAAVDTWFVAVRNPGQVAVAYYGKRREQSTYDGFITSTRDALSANPTFVSARVNHTERPLKYGERIMGSPFALVDYIGVDIGPDGTPWAAFSKDCGPSPTAAACQANDNQTRGWIGHLVTR
jgi:hypothetical protein